MEKSSTTRFQRIGIWVIAIVLAIGTVAGFVALVFSNQNSAADTQALQTACTEYSDAVQKQADDLSAMYYDEFSQYASRVGEFDAKSVTDLVKTDLKIGDGDTLTADSSFTAYYIGWNPYGKIFDESIDGTKLKTPLDVVPGTVITGWTAGIAGMKVGGVRELTIPADQAYGANPPSGQTDIEANMPLKFIIMVIPTPESITVPQVLEDYYTTNGVSPC